ncbi:MAG: hypothetical protein ACUVT5_03210 [Candidatus Bathyarchaeales archaeon]
MEGKKVIIVVRLIKEADGKSNRRIEREIMQELAEGMPKIPWQDEIQKIVVLD